MIVVVGVVVVGDVVGRLRRSDGASTVRGPKAILRRVMS